MRLTIKTAHGYLSFQPDGRLEYRPTAGDWEYLDVDGFELPAPVPVPMPPSTPVPAWPPAPGTMPVMPPDIDTVDVKEVQARVRYALWACASDDDESYWMRVIVLAPEHTPGWTHTGYWRLEKIFKGDGVGKGYKWPPT